MPVRPTRWRHERAAGDGAPEPRRGRRTLASGGRRRRCPTAGSPRASRPRARARSYGDAMDEAARAEADAGEIAPKRESLGATADMVDRSGLQRRIGALTERHHALTARGLRATGKASVAIEREARALGKHIDALQAELDAAGGRTDPDIMHGEMYADGSPLAAEGDASCAQQPSRQLRRRRARASQDGRSRSGAGLRQRRARRRTAVRHGPRRVQLFRERRRAYPHRQPGDLPLVQGQAVDSRRASPASPRSPKMPSAHPRSGSISSSRTRSSTRSTRSRRARTLPPTRTAINAAGLREARRCARTWRDARQPPAPPCAGGHSAVCSRADCSGP
jgi:hypothetical protein